MKKLYIRLQERRTMDIIIEFEVAKMFLSLVRNISNSQEEVELYEATASVLRK